MMDIDFLDPEQTENFVAVALADQPERLRHVQVIAELARQSARDINELNPGLNLDEIFVFCAAMLHDIGYAAEARDTGFHPLDGYRFLMGKGFPRLAECIVSHSCSKEEGTLLGFELPDTELNLATKLVTYWDMRVKQGGEFVTYSERYQDIMLRYGEQSVVGQANMRARPRIETIIAEIDRLLKNIAD